MILFIMIPLLLIALIIIDSLIYKLRGSAQPDDDDDTTVITGPGDAGAQRYIDLFKLADKYKKKDRD